MNSSELKYVLKRSILLVFILFPAFSGQLLSAQNRRYLVDSLTTLIDGYYAPYDKVMPGDTLVFEHGKRDFILIRNFHGEADKQVVFINDGGIVKINTNNYYGISIRNCRFFRFTGTGSSNFFYGFKIERVEHGGGIGIGEGSSDFEIDHITIEDCQGAGINAKTDPDCTYTATRDKFTQFNTIIHDNQISGVSNEGLYIGSTKYFGQTVHCNGLDTLVLPALLNGVRIYNNIIKYTGWDGIQVSSASSDCKVFDNMILFDSQEGFYNQMSGILLGGGSKCECYNNFISQGKGNGIEIHGLGGNRIFNNIIVDAGRSFLPSDSSQMLHGIFVSDVSAELDSSFYILNNDIINPRSDGIRFSSIRSQHNLVASNLIVNPGNYDFYENGPTSFKGVDSYIMIPNAAADVAIANNYFSRTAAGAGFSAEDYTLLPGSPLIDSAYAENKGILFDFYNHPRPYGTAADIGAFEYNPAYLGIPYKLPGSINRLLPFPNPVRTMLTIQYQIGSSTDIFLYIYNLQGICIRQVQEVHVNAGFNRFNVNVGTLLPGIYLFTIRSNTSSATGRFLKAN
jgi:hypothetical protein